MEFIGGICATCGKPVPGGGHTDECTGAVPGSEYRIDGGPSYAERHGHAPDEPCSMFCPGNPAKLGGNGGATTFGDITAAGGRGSLLRAAARVPAAE